MMTKPHPHAMTDGTPISADMSAALVELSRIEHEVSRARAALRDLGGALADPDDPLSECYRAGLCEAVTLIGDHLEHYTRERIAALEDGARAAAPPDGHRQPDTVR